MRAPSAILRSLHLRRIQPQAAAVVAPLPEQTRFDQQLTAELDTLHSQGTTNNAPNFPSFIGLVELLDASITTQKIALESFVNLSYRDDLDRGALEEYLESNVEILDACNYFVEKIEIIRKYVDSLRVAARSVDGSAKAMESALHQLESCHDIERERKIMAKGSLCLRRILRQKLYHETEFSEIMCGSKAMAMMVCRALELGLSFDSKRRLPSMMQSQAHPTSSSWLGMLQELAKLAEGSDKPHKRRSGSCLMMSELEQTVCAAQDLKEQIKGKREKEMKFAVEGLKKSCRELEDGLVVIEGRVRELYKSLIDVRMGLLGILSQA